NRAASRALVDSPNRLSSIFAALNTRVATRVTLLIGGSTMIGRLFGATTALLHSTQAFSAPAQTREAKITFFIWVRSNQGLVPQEVFKPYREKNYKVEIEVH